MPLHQSNFDFLNQLKANNNREWFAENKPLYEEQRMQIVGFADELLTLLQQHDNIETPNGKKSLFRIYRDTRFSKDKTPYKTHWGFHFKRATERLRGGYYLHLELDNVFVGGGFWSPNPADLKRIREDIATNDQELRAILDQPIFKNNFGKLGGEQVKSAPKGYTKDHPAIDLLKYKQFLVSKKFSNNEALSPSFTNKVNSTFEAMRPFFDYMSLVLTTDTNGISLVD